MGKESRVMHLQKDLVELGFYQTLNALNWMIGIMNADNGYARHDGSHYYYHLVDGCQDLINHGIRDQNTLTAFILHDSKEDIIVDGKRIVTDALLTKKYNAEVAFLVDGVTKKEGIDYKQPENIQAYLDYILQFAKMCLIKLADRKHNFSTLEDASPEKELRQALETENHFLPFAKAARALHPEYSAYFHSFKTTIVPHLKKVKKYHEDIAVRDRRINELEAMLKVVGVKE